MFFLFATDAYTIEDVRYEWRKADSKKSIEIFVAEMAQFDLTRVMVGKKASKNSKGEVYNNVFLLTKAEPVMPNTSGPNSMAQSSGKTKTKKIKHNYRGHLLY